MKKLKIGMKLLYINVYGKPLTGYVKEQDKLGYFKIDWYWEDKSYSTTSHWYHDTLNALTNSKTCKIINEDPEKVCKLQ